MIRRETHVVITGHLDHGKSTLLGQLLCQCRALPKERLAEVDRASRDRGRTFDPSMVLDQLKEERDDSMTLDVTEAQVCMADVSMIFIDTPGHWELIGNMVSGTGMADAAIIVVDVAGGGEGQAFVHLQILHLLNVRRVVAVVNKMDLVDYREGPFEELRQQLCRELRGCGLAPEQVVPTSALHDENLVRPSGKMAWYTGPHLLGALVALRPPGFDDRGPICFPVQHVINDRKGAIHCGRLESGSVCVGQRLTVLPEQQSVVVRSIETHTKGQRSAAGECLGLTLQDGEILRRGQVLCDPSPWPRALSRGSFEMIWLGDSPVVAGRRLHVCPGLQRAPCVVEEVKKRGPGGGQRPQFRRTDALRRHELGLVDVCFDRPLVMDPTSRLRPLNRAIFHDQGAVCAVGTLAS